MTDVGAPMLPPVYGVMAQFADPERLVAAAKAATQAGYVRVEAYTPFPVEGLSEAIGFTSTRIPLVALLAGLAGAGCAYFMQWYSAVVDYPINVGGRPLHSAPAFIPITFEMTILFSATAIFVAMLAMNRLPKPYHPVFNSATFARASQDGFFLCIEAADARFEAAEVTRFLTAIGGEDVHAVEP